MRILYSRLLTACRQFFAGHIILSRILDQTSFISLFSSFFRFSEVSIAVWIFVRAFIMNDIVSQMLALKTARTSAFSRDGKLLLSLRHQIYMDLWPCLP